MSQKTWSDGEMVSLVEIYPEGILTILIILILLCLRNSLENFSGSFSNIPVRHSREGGNPGQLKLDSPPTLLRTVSLSNGRLRGSDNHAV